MYLPDDTGIFTDTANYTMHIPECTNVSCGYANEHSGSETLHMPTLMALRNQCLVLDWESLPTVRDPRVIERDELMGWQTYRTAKTTPTPGGNARYLYSMSKAEMLDMAYEDPETFVALVREEIFGEELYESENYYEDISGWSYGS
jgi:hypothetical protein